MSFNGSGTFIVNSAGNPVVTGTTISSTWMNALSADLATGLSTCITKDGTQATTARIPFIFGINSSLVTDSTSIGTGSIITAGGIGITKALWVGGLTNIAGAVTLQSTLAVTGAVTLTAGISATTGTFSGAVSGTTGTFSVGLQSTVYFSTSGILYIGGTSASEVSLRQSSGQLLVRLGDDSGYANVNAKDVLALGGHLYISGATSSTVMMKNSTTTLLIRKGDDSGDANLSCATLTPTLLNYVFGGFTGGPALYTSFTFSDGLCTNAS